MLFYFLVPNLFKENVLFCFFSFLFTIWISPNWILICSLIPLFVYYHFYSYWFYSQREDLSWFKFRQRLDWMKFNVHVNKPQNYSFRNHQIKQKSLTNAITYFSTYIPSFTVACHVDSGRLGAHCLSKPRFVWRTTETNWLWNRK